MLIVLRPKQTHDMLLEFRAPNKPMMHFFFPKIIDFCEYMNILLNKNKLMPWYLQSNLTNLTRKSVAGEGQAAQEAAASRQRGRVGSAAEQEPVSGRNKQALPPQARQQAR